MRSLYFDHNASTPIDPRVADAMEPWLRGSFGNPDSPHQYGRRARAALEEAREEVAALLGAEARDVVFMASGTEALNTAIRHIARTRPEPGRALLSTLEHPAVMAGVARACAEGWTASRIAPCQDGVVDPQDFTDRLAADVGMVCLMRAHNELGTLQPVAELAAACRQRQIALICDAVQAVGKIEVDVVSLGADFVAVGAHKFHGPLGVGALWIRPGIELHPFLVGGGHERGRRASTPAVPLLVGFGRAARLARLEESERRAGLAHLRDRFEQGLLEIPGAIVHCATSPRLPNTSHLRVEGVSGQELAAWLDEQGIAVSTGAACKGEPTAALAALGLDAVEAAGAMRVSFGLGQHEDDVHRLLQAFALGVEALRSSRGPERVMIGPS